MEKRKLKENWKQLVSLMMIYFHQK